MTNVNIKETNGRRKVYKNIQLLIDKQNNIPSLQLINKNNNISIDISTACKPFVSFSKKYIRYKLFLKNKVIRIIFNKDESTDLVKEINDLLLNYHLTEEIKKDELISVKSTNEGGDTTDNVRVDLSHIDEISENDINSKSSSICIAMSELDIMSQYNTIFKMDYTIPNFDEKYQPYDKSINIEIDLPGSDDIPHDNLINVLVLKQQILNIGGVKLKMDTTVLPELSLKEHDEKLWITKANRTTKEYERLHFGDRIVKILNNQINSEIDLHEYIKETNFDITIQRLPMAKVFMYDKTKFQNSSFQLRKKKYYQFKYDNSSNEIWVVTELNGYNALDLSKNLNTLKALIDSNPKYLTIIMQPEEFVNILME